MRFKLKTDPLHVRHANTFSDLEKDILSILYTTLIWRKIF